MCVIFEDDTDYISIHDTDSVKKSLIGSFIFDSS